MAVALPSASLLSPPFYPLPSPPGSRLAQLRAMLAVLLLLLVAAPGAPGAHATYVGGAFIAAPLENALVKAFRKAAGVPFDNYTATSAEDGINSFTTGDFLVGVTDIPMSVLQETELKKFKKYTIPQAYTTFSFFTALAPGIRLTPSQLVGIFLGKITKWRQVGVKSSLKITPVARSDAAGLQVIITRYLYRASRNSRDRYLWPLSAVGEGPFPKVYGKNVIQVQGNPNMGKTIQTTPGAIGYLQTGIGINTWALNEIAVLNLAKVFETAQGFGNPVQALPRNPPPAGSSWASVDLVYKDGQRTYPMVAFIYALYRQSYRKVPGGGVVKRWGLFTLSTSGQGLAANYFFYPLPKPYLIRGIRALKSIKV